MNNRTQAVLAIAAALYLAAPSHSQEKAGADCSRVAEAAREGARLKGAGMSPEDVELALAKQFSQYEAGMGLTAAFTYVDLKDFAMSDFVESYCRVTVGKGGQLSDFDMMMIRSRYDLSVQCAKQGRTEKRPFLDCWNDQVRRAREAAASEPK